MKKSLIILALLQTFLTMGVYGPIAFSELREKDVKGRSSPIYSAPTAQGIP